MTNVLEAVPAHREPDRRPPCDLELVIPTFNEEYRLPATLLALLAELEEIRRRDGLSCRIVVVDNGSWDRTSEVADQFALTYPDSVVVIGCATGGKGAAVQRGMLTSSARHVGFVDADLAVPAEALHAVVALLTGRSDVVIASRRCEGASYAVRQSAVRRMGSWVFRQVVRDLLPGVSDTQCGFKFFSAAAARDVFHDLHTTGFSFDVELLVRAHAHGYRIDELPVAWSDGAASSLNPVSHGGQILRELLVLRRIGQQLAADAG